MILRTMEDAAASLNIILPIPIPPDGKIHRFGEKGQKGVPHFAVNYGDAGAVGTFKGGHAKATFHAHGDTLTESQRKSLVTQIALAKAKQEREQQERYAAGARDAVATWNSLFTTGRSSYLTHKQVGAYGIRFGNGFIAIPMRQSVGGAIHSVQLIYDDPATPVYMRKEGRNKTFIKDGRKTGCFHAIGNKALVDHRSTYLCEGYATGSSVHMATGLPVFVTFDCGNLKPVLERLVKIYPTHTFTIAADDDHWKDCNAGKEKALEAAGDKYAVILPRFQPESLLHHPTDFNDLHVLEGLDMVHAQLLAGGASCN